MLYKQKNLKKISLISNFVILKGKFCSIFFNSADFQINLQFNKLQQSGTYTHLRSENAFSSRDHNSSTCRPVQPEHTIKYNKYFQRITNIYKS